MTPTDTDHGAAPGYRAGATLPIRVELRRQLRRRRTAVTLGLLVLLPVLLLVAFAVGTESEPGEGRTLTDLATSSGGNFTVFVLFSAASFLLVVVVALFFGDTVASEASWSTLRYLLAVPVPRSRLLRQKAVVASLLSALAMVLLLAVSLAVGTIAYGTGDLVSPTGEALPYATAVLRLLLAGGYLLVHLAWIAGLALLLSVSTDAPLAAVGGAVLASIVFSILDEITALGELRNVLPSDHAFAWTDLLSPAAPLNDLAVGAFSGLAYATAFGLLAWRRFTTRDITS